MKAERTEVGTCHVGLAKLAPTLSLGTFIILIDHKGCLEASFLKATRDFSSPGEEDEEG